jgi:hypothetical protein
LTIIPVIPLTITSVAPLAITPEASTAAPPARVFNSKTPPRGDRGGALVLGTRRSSPYFPHPSHDSQTDEQARNRNHHLRSARHWGARRCPPDQLTCGKRTFVIAIT